MERGLRCWNRPSWYAGSLPDLGPSSTSCLRPHPRQGLREGLLQSPIQPITRSSILEPSKLVRRILSHQSSRPYILPPRRRKDTIDPRQGDGESPANPRVTRSSILEPVQLVGALDGEPTTYVRPVHLAPNHIQGDRAAGSGSAIQFLG